MVGAVGSAAPWFLTGWTNDVEVEFMIDTGCQVTILATSVFERMCEVHPQLRTELVPCTQRLVSVVLTTPTRPTNGTTLGRRQTPTKPHPNS